MAKCEICGKGVNFGLQVSHSNRKSNRSWSANVKSVRANVEGTVKSMTKGARDYEVTVDFDGVGPKIMYAAFAKLQKVE
jgi:large subunit ribosomal protein L28